MTAADSERDERPIYDWVMVAYEAHRRAGQEMHSALLDIWRMADPEGRKHLTYRDPSDVVMSVRALIAEQAATIERVRGVADHPDPRMHPPVVDQRDLLAALGSQRTEGQG